MPIFRRTRLYATMGAVLSALALTATATPSTAAASWEVDYATRMSPFQYRCPGVDAYLGRSELKPDYYSCFILNGDRMLVQDLKADSKAAVMKWQFKTNINSRATRQGICIYTGGSTAKKNAGTCSKNLPETGYMRLYAGYRLKATTHLSDMKFGSPVCMRIKGSSGALLPCVSVGAW